MATSAKNTRKLPKRRKLIAASASADQDDSKKQSSRGKAKIESKDIEGLKYLEMLEPLLEQLHNDQCERDKANQRTLHYDKYCMLVLLYMFNPTVTSLRAIQQASELSKVQKKLGCKRTSLGSLNAASTVFDSQRLQAIISELGAKAAPLGRDAKLRDIQQNITLVDGSLVSALPSLIQASFFKDSTQDSTVKWRLHTHFEIANHLPTRIDVTPDGRGENEERPVLARTLESDRLYVMDRGYQKFSLFNQIVDAGSSYACRLKDNSDYNVVETRELSEADVVAGVISDEVVTIGKSKNAADRPSHAVRLICIKCSQHTSRGRYKGTSTGPSSDGVLRIATNLLDVPAEIIGLIYSQRWAIEIFFRFFKQFLGCAHLISHNQNGIEIQCYCAIIACMLINLWTGRKPTKRTFEMLCYFFIGLATEAELVAHLEKLNKRDEAQAKKS
jgi:hypothetical protein